MKYARKERLESMNNTSLEEAIDELANLNKISLDGISYEFNTFRALMNITMPNQLTDSYFMAQDQVIQEYYKDKTIIDVNDLIPIWNNLYLWQGDITLLKADGIVNACNSELLGCFQPLHNCIDNAIHSFAGLQVRRDLVKMMFVQGKLEPNGRAKITKGYNLPATYILHTVGPIVKGCVTKENERDLYNCYLSCLKKAEEFHLKSLVFCSISTGIYAYPIEKACKVAVKAVLDYFSTHTSAIEKIIFNVFKREDYNVYYREIKKINRRG